MSDPLSGIFGQSALELFLGQRFTVTHGPLERLPAFMHAGPMESIDSLCRYYTGPVEMAQGTAEAGLQVPVTDAHPAALLRMGLTVYFTDLRRLPEARGWLRSLEGALGLPECATLAAFSNSRGSGLALHHDRFDQLFFQLQGTKRFRHAPNGFVEKPDVQFSPYSAAPPDFGQTYRHGFPLTSEAILEQKLETLVLEPGSAFFMPAGTWHTTAEQDGESLSMVVVLRAPSRLELLQNWVRYYAEQSPDWRARPYGGFAPDGAARDQEHATLKALIAELCARLPTLDPALAVSAFSAHGFTMGTHAEYPRAFRFERYIRLPNSELEFEAGEANGKLRAVVHSGPTNRPQARTPLAFNTEARPIFEWVLGLARAFSVSEAAEKFPEFSTDDIAELFATLAQAALIRPLPAPEWDKS